MLNIDDIDIVIKLLEDHNWDVSQAANSYYASQFARGGAHEESNPDRHDLNN